MPDTSPLLPKDQITRIQSIVGSLLYYEISIDGAILKSLHTISVSQSEPTEKTSAQCKQLLDYAATYPNVFLRFHSSDMVLNIYSDAAYLVAPKARSHVSGYFQLNSNTKFNTTFNGTLLVECKNLQHVVESSAEA